ncbi:MAG: hypothetical protein IM667_14975 [Phenylobacterium sp.]|uniref:DUF6615 family protein n=1 Tax=Phenylobacterium sp. TaxID=1871053 RepID=UPI0025E2F329|nr:DUF6615 family protein [Phenylobacterium sp.]MCA3713091.1 hypothetical protein [Phenylobacterium sp.]MCA3751703.1 hypothetical protein [Phenylobacterium sp.]MCA6228793.1 hypothetical protein [Phenylobacterium sp.]MCA6241932.1 hypothetical protein [Phenylobacterium sp.]
MTDICSTFKELGQLIWDRMAAAKTHNLKWSEETSTETLLLELMSRHGNQVTIEAFSKKKEAENGSDWEWWIMGAGGRWHGLRVQAKRLRPKEGVFWRLQEFKAARANDKQIDTLIRSAEASDLALIPIYCLYVTECERLKKWEFWATLASQPKNGCQIALATEVKATATNCAGVILERSLPWQFLVCPGEVGETLGSEKLRSFGNHVHRRPGSPASGSDREREFPEGLNQPPPYMRSLLEGLDAGDRPRWPPSEALIARAREQNLRGFVLIRPSYR